MNHSDAPRSVRVLEQRLREAEGAEGPALRRRVAMALVVVGQMLPEGAVKGGSAMALRYGKNTRFTKDFDAARVNPLDEFRNDFESSLVKGWGGFTGRLVQKAAPRPTGVPPVYVMQPFEVKLSYLGRSWCTVTFELGHNEIGDADGPQYALAPDLAELFTEVGLDRPAPVAVLPVDHQIAQKLHAVTTPEGDRARDLVDLQLLHAGEDLDLPQIAATCERLFNYRRLQPWPPTVAAGREWESLYTAAAEDLEVLPTVDEAVTWANQLVDRIAGAAPARGTGV